MDAISDVSIRTAITTTLAQQPIDREGLARFLHKNIPIYKAKKKQTDDALFSLLSSLSSSSSSSSSAPLDSPLSSSSLLPLPTLPKISYDITLDDLKLLQRDAAELFYNWSKVMDVYLMARVFRDFDETKARGPGRKDAIRRVIIYAGDAHIRNYIRTFEAIGDLKKIVSTSSSESSSSLSHQCINLRRFTQPFFYLSDAQLDDLNARRRSAPAISVSDQQVASRPRYMTNRRDSLL